MLRTASTLKSAESGDYTHPSLGCRLYAWLSTGSRCFGCRPKAGPVSALATHPSREQYGPPASSRPTSPGRYCGHSRPLAVPCAVPGAFEDALLVW